MRKIGDVLVAHGAQKQTWPTASNVAIRLTYPASGLGAQVTYINVDVDQVCLELTKKMANR